MSGLWIAVSVDLKARYDILCVVVFEHLLESLQLTDMPIKHYESPIVMSRAVVQYAQEHKVDRDVPVVVIGNAVYDLGVKVGDFLDYNDKKVKLEAEMAIDNAYSDMAEQEMDRLDQDEAQAEEDRFYIQAGDGPWNPPL